MIASNRIALRATQGCGHRAVIHDASVPVDPARICSGLTSLFALCPIDLWSQRTMRRVSSGELHPSRSAPTDRCAST
jgi:hypothetical protein